MEKKMRERRRQRVFNMIDSAVKLLRQSRVEREGRMGKVKSRGKKERKGEINSGIENDYAQYAPK